MGLFDGKAKQEAAENEVRQKLAAVPLLDLLIENLLDAKDKPWLHMGQSYYDSCRRTVTVEPDSFEIKWSTHCEEPYIGDDGQRHTKTVERVHGQICYSYTDSGYLPLHSYVCDSSKKAVSTERVCYLWASVIRERMAASMPACKFGDVTDGATFTYSVPKLSFKDWF